jgi:hypothetical protein
VVRLGGASDLVDDLADACTDDGASDLVDAGTNGSSNSQDRAERGPTGLSRPGNCPERGRLRVD